MTEGLILEPSIDNSLEVVYWLRDPQLQVSENYSDVTENRSMILKYCRLMSRFVFNMFKSWLFNVLKK